MDTMGWDMFDIYLYVEEYQADLDADAKSAGYTVTWPATREGLRSMSSKVVIFSPDGDGGEFSCWALLSSKQSVKEFFKEWF